MYERALKHLTAVIGSGVHKLNPSYADQWFQVNQRKLDNTYKENLYEVAHGVKETLEKKGIVFRMNAKVQSVKHIEDGAVVVFSDSQTGEVVELEADAVLLATGRRPNTKDLNLEVAGVETDARGAIIVDEYLKTTQPNIRAVGDVKGGLQFTYISLDDYCS